MYLHTIIVALWYLAAGIVTNLHLISRYSEQFVFLYSNFRRPELRNNNFRPLNIILLQITISEIIYDLRDPHLSRRRFLYQSWIYP
jgi:hypothetical protein